MCRCYRHVKVPKANEWKITQRKKQKMLMCMVMQHHKLECHAEKLVHCVQCQGHSEGLYDQNMTVSVVSSKLLVRLQPNLV